MRLSDEAHAIATVFEMEMEAEGHIDFFEDNGIILRKLWFPLWIMLERGMISVGPSAPLRETEVITPCA